MTITIGRIVTYALTHEDADTINRRRTTREYIAHRIQLDTWPKGAQAHMGPKVLEGLRLPMIVTEVSPRGVSGQVFLNGTDTLWVTFIAEGEHDGQWSWPDRGN